MICFRDKTFCSALVHNEGCDRQWTKGLQEQADRWWGKPGAPVAFSNLCGGEGDVLESMTDE